MPHRILCQSRRRLCRTCICHRLDQRRGFRRRQDSSASGRPPTPRAKHFTIWLSDDGAAKGDRANEGLAGMWKEAGSAAVITWDSGWVTKITKDGDRVYQDRGEGRQGCGQPVRRRKGRVAVQL